MLVDRPKTKKSTKWFFVQVTFVIVVFLWLVFLTVTQLNMDDAYKRRIQSLEDQVGNLKNAQKEMSAGQH